MNIALMSHDRKKELMIQFCIAYRSILAKHTLSATNATGKQVIEATGLPISLYMGRNQGGGQQVSARIAYNEVDLLIYFTDPNSPGDAFQDPFLLEILRLCDQHNVPVATNLATAEMLILGLDRGDLDWRMVAKGKKV